MSLRACHKNCSGQILTSVLVFMAFGLSVIALSSILTIINMQNTAKHSEGAKTLSYAEAGAEEGILRIIRDPAYAGGSMAIDTAVVNIQVSGDSVNKTIVSTSRYGGFTRKIEVQINIAEGKVNLVSWKQII